MSPVERLKRSGKRNRFTAICLLICLGAAIIQGVLPSAVASIAAAPFFCIYLAISSRYIARVGWVLLFFSLAIALLALANGIDPGIFVQAAGRVVFELERRR